MLRPVLFISFASLFASALLAADAIVWNQPIQSEAAAIGQEQVVAVFSFTNQGDKMVRLTEVHPSCGCTVPTLEKDTYNPGESGKITATFTIGNRVGHQVKTIQVYTDEPGRKEPYTLTLKVDIPEAIKLSSRTLIWRTGDEATTKECQIELHPDLPLHIDSATPLAGGNEADFEIELIEVAPNSIYQVHVTPKSAGKSARVTLQLGSDSDKAEILKGYLIYAVVYPASR